MGGNDLYRGFFLIKIYALIIGIAVGLFVLSARLGRERKGTITVVPVNISSHRVVVRD